MALRRGCCARSFARQKTQARYRAARSGGSRGTFFEEEGPESAQQANAEHICKVELSIGCSLAFWRSHAEKTATVAHLKSKIGSTLAFWHFHVEETTTVAHFEPRIGSTLAFWRFHVEKTTTVAHFEPRIGSTLAFWRFHVEKTTTVAHFGPRIGSTLAFRAVSKAQHLSGFGFSVSVLRYSCS